MKSYLYLLIIPAAILTMLAMTLFISSERKVDNTTNVAQRVNR